MGGYLTEIETQKEDSFLISEVSQLITGKGTIILIGGPQVLQVKRELENRQIYSCSFKVGRDASILPA